MLYKHYISLALITRLVNEVQNKVGCGLGYDESRKQRSLIKKPELLDPTIPRRNRPEGEHTYPDPKGVCCSNAIEGFSTAPILQ